VATNLVTRVRSRVFSEGSLTKKASLNLISTALNQAARALVGFVVNPILLRYLGDVRFGNWQVVNRLIGQANPAGGRTSEALKWFIAHRQSSDDLQLKRQAVASSILVWLIFIPILLPIGAAVGWFAPIWLDVPPGQYAEIRLTAAVLLAGAIAMGLTNIPWASLTGENLGYKRMGITAGIELLGGGLMVVAVVSGGGLVRLAWATVAVTLLSGVLYLWLARVHIPWFGVARPDASAVRRFMGLSWWFLVWNFVSRATMGGDIVVLGIAGTAAQVTSYSLTRFIPLTITGSVASLIFGMAPGLGGLIGAGEMVRAARVRSETMAVAWLLTTVAGAGVLLWEESFLRLWVGQRYFPGVLPTLLIVLMILQLTLIRVDSNIIDLTLNVRRKVLLGLLSVVLSVGFAWFLVARLDLGIAGVAAGFIAGRAVQSVTYPLIIGRILTIPTSAQLAAMIRPGLVTAGLLGAAAALSRVVAVHTWPGLIAASAVSGVLLLAIAVLGGLSDVQRRWLWSRAKRVIRLR
jgi:O-antigen/teichoic acid export membrane protein